jgi:hypothetical protein
MNTALGDRIFTATKITRNQAQLVTAFSLLAEWMDDPDPERQRKRKNAPIVPERLERARYLRSLVQRDFTGRKKANLPKYRAYIERLIDTEPIDADLPEVVLWTETLLQHSDNLLAIPPDPIFVAVDGETQIAARFDLMNQPNPKGARYPIVVRLHHGIGAESAAQLFYLRNALGAEVSKAQALMRNQTDPLAIAARSISQLLPGLFADTTDPKRPNFVTLIAALSWAIVGRVALGRSQPLDFDERLSAAKVHLVKRLVVLQPLLEKWPVLRRGPLFVAATDHRVDPDHFALLNWEEPAIQVSYWNLTNKATDACIDWLRQPALLKV